MMSKLSHHTDGKRLSVPPNSKTISYSVFISLIGGRLQNNYQYGHNEDHINRHHNYDFTHIQGLKESHEDKIVLRNTYTHILPLNTVFRTSGGSTGNGGFWCLFLRTNLNQFQFHVLLFKM